MLAVLVTNVKGGVGKSTFAINIASHLGSLGSAKVKLLDLDPLGYLHGSTFFRQLAEGKPSSWGFAPETDIVRVDSSRQALKRALEGLQGVSAVVMDSRASLDAGELYAAERADLVVMPVTPGTGEVEATIRLALTLKQRQDGEGFPRICIAPTAWEKNKKCAKHLEDLKSTGEVVLPVVHKKDTVQTAFAEGVSVVNGKGRSVLRSEMRASIWAALELVKGML